MAGEKDFIVKHFRVDALKGNAKRAKALLMFTIYYNPSDYPGRYVVRPSLVKENNVNPLQVIVLGKTYEDVVSKIPIEELGLARFAREEEDDKVILETWL